MLRGASQRWVALGDDSIGRERRRRRRLCFRFYSVRILDRWFILSPFLLSVCRWGTPPPPPALCCRSRGRFSMSFFGFVVVVVDGEKAVQGQRHIQFSVFFVAAAVAGVAVVVAAAVVVSHIHGLRSVWLFSRFCLFRVASAATAFFFRFFARLFTGFLFGRIGRIYEVQRNTRSPTLVGLVEKKRKCLQIFGKKISFF